MRASCRHAPGVTLLAVLVAMTLLALLAALLAGGVHFGARVWHRGEDQLQALAAVQSAHGLMRRALAQAVPVSAPGGSVIFQGTPAWVRFTAPAPSDLLVGGHYEITFGLSHDERAQHLVMAWRRRVQAADALAAPGGGQVLLVRDVAELSFAFFAAEDDDEAPRWQESWAERPALPLLVRVAVRFPDGDPRRWPELVVAPMLHLAVE